MKGTITRTSAVLTAVVLFILVAAGQAQASRPIPPGGGGSDDTSPLGSAPGGVDTTSTLFGVSVPMAIVAIVALVASVGLIVATTQRTRRHRAA